MQSDIVQQLNYIAAVLEANKNKFTVPGHIPAKIKTVHEAAAEITRLTEALREADENINLKADFIDATINQLAAKDQDIYELKEALRAAEEREKGLRADLLRCFRGETHAVRNERVNRKILEYTEAALKGPSHDQQ